MVLNEHKTRVRELAAAFNLEHQSREPLDLAAAIGAKLEYGDLGDKDGAFDPNRKVVFLSKTATLERQRFTMAHEVTHALILADEDFLSDLHDAYEGDDLEEAIEILCNVGASAILVPEIELEALLQKYGRGARAIGRIVKSFTISRPAACVVLAQSLDGKAIVAVLRARTKPKSLEVEFSARSSEMRYALSNGTVIPEDHPAQVALETGLPLSEESYIPFRSGKKMPAMVDVHPEGNVAFVVFMVIEKETKESRATG
jgi:Zn-dependent peptidase ImmA (M78 family)